MTTHEMSCPWVTLFTTRENDYYGTVATIEQAEDLIRTYEVATVSKFCIYRRNKGFTDDKIDITHHRILWEDFHSAELHIPYSGVPFIIMGGDRRECQNGPDRHTRQKQRYKAQKGKVLEVDHPYYMKTGGAVPKTKKVCCTAKIQLKRIIKFPEFKIQGAKSQYRRKLQSTKLRLALSQGANMLMVQEIYISLPEITAHCNHVTGELAGSSQPVDVAIRNKIQELVNEGTSKVPEVKKRVKAFVQDEIFNGQEVPDSRRYRPTLKDIHNHIRLSKKRLKNSKVEVQHQDSRDYSWQDQILVTKPEEDLLAETWILDAEIIEISDSDS